MTPIHYTQRKLRLKLLPQTFAICRLAPGQPIPGWAFGGAFFSVTRTPEEVSIVVEEKQVPQDVRSHGGFHALQVVGPLGFDEVGILATLTDILAYGGISVLSISTFDTDYLFVQDIDDAEDALTAQGHTVETGSSSGAHEQ